MRSAAVAAPETSPLTDLKSLLDRITQSYPDLSPQLRNAAKRVLEAPEEVALKSMRGFASDAVVPPSTMVRLAKAAGFDSYEAFRDVFQRALRSVGTDFASRAEWLQQLPEKGRDAEVLGGMAGAVMENVEAAFRGNPLAAIEAAAEALRRGRRIFVIGVGGMHALAVYFHYVARMALPEVRLAAPAMATMIDELTDIGEHDAALILSVEPYATETVRAAEFVRQRRARLVAITDSRASPVAPLATDLLLVSTTTPQFFPSQAATIALLESVLALIVSHGDRHVLERIERVDRHRRDAGIYWSPPR